MDPTAYVYGAGQRSSDTTYITVSPAVIPFFLAFFIASRSPLGCSGSASWEWQDAGCPSMLIVCAYPGVTQVTQGVDLTTPPHPNDIPTPPPYLQRNGYPYVLWARDLSSQLAMQNTHGHWPFVMVQEQGTCAWVCPGRSSFDRMDLWPSAGARGKT